jgi:hypothetical protein
MANSRKADVIVKTSPSNQAGWSNDLKPSAS